MKYNDLSQSQREKLFQRSSDCLRDYAYKHGNVIYDFMDANKIGKSTVGALMDAAGRGRGVMAHRLYGHHLIYDFPINNLHEAAPFLEHLFSDLFTKQGLPILPGELLENLGLKKCCSSLTHNWNFVNGFDILSGTTAVYSGILDFKKTFIEDVSINSIDDIASTIGIGSLEMAIALSTANPFLLIGGVLSLTSGLKGLINTGSVVYFKNVNMHLSLEFSTNTLNIKNYVDMYKIENNTDYSIDGQISKYSF